MADGEPKSAQQEIDATAESLSVLRLKKIEDEVSSSYVLVDIGANLTNSKYSRDLDSVVERAKDAGQPHFQIKSMVSHSLLDFRSQEDYGYRCFHSVQQRILKANKIVSWYLVFNSW